ncbi:MAG: dihydropteroate synthase [Elusimicrobiota bacterium]|nr:dihydropteroate synthase [Elusimicrobiota bacterium]
MRIRQVFIESFDDALKLVNKTQSCPIVHTLLAKKGFGISLYIEKIDNRAAAILKQEALACGAEVSINEGVSRFKRGFSNAVLFASLRRLELLKNKLASQPFELKDAARQIDDVINNASNPQKIFKCRQFSLDLKKPAVMGIINVDPNSFSGDGITDPDKACQKAVEFENLGAKIIDLGAESSRPGTALIDYKSELKRLLPALKKIRKAVKIPISIDTYKYETSKAALDEGADIINDIFALSKGKEKLAKLISDTKAGIILMHSKGNPLNMQKKPQYKDCVKEVFDYLEEKKKNALGFGIEPDFISVDPGIGFAKTVDHNLSLIRSLKTFSWLGIITLGVSRKNFVRTVAGSSISSFVAANFLGVLRGADIIRVHDVKETIEALRLL